jgi:hypothetical protein
MQENVCAGGQIVGVALSASLWLSPPWHGTKSMPVGATRVLDPNCRHGAMFGVMLDHQPDRR